MRIAVGLALGIVSTGCTLTPEALPAADDVYTRAEIDERFGFLADCQQGGVLVREASGWSCTQDPACPPGFAHTSEDGATICTRQVADAADVIVRVGDFWIDRHESALCPGDGSVGTGPGNDTTAAACSTPGVEPIVSVTWFQAAQLCANAGKHLCTNAQWQKAAAGTPDPRAWPGSVCSVPPESGLCNTCSATPRPTGQAAQCTSRWGAEDMIGNTWEWVADWHVGGTRWQTAPGQAATPWPAAQGYGDDADATFNVNGKPNTSVAATNGAPSAPLRSGANADGTTGGSFAFNASVAPSFRGASVGGRCCLGTASQ